MCGYGLDFNQSYKIIGINLVSFNILAMLSLHNMIDIIIQMVYYILYVIGYIRSIRRNIS